MLIAFMGDHGFFMGHYERVGRLTEEKDAHWVLEIHVL